MEMIVKYEIKEDYTPGVIWIVELVSTLKEEATSIYAYIRTSHYPAEEIGKAGKAHMKLVSQRKKKGWVVV